MLYMIKKAAAVLAVAAVAVLGLQAPAQAYPNCASTQICFYDLFNGNTGIWEQDSADRPGCTTLPPSIRNRISSVDNITVTGSAIIVYTTSSNCTGANHNTIWAGTQGNMSGTWNNNIDSYYVT
jgi:hypothetical protein